MAKTCLWKLFCGKCAHSNLDKESKRLIWKNGKTANNQKLPRYFKNAFPWSVNIEKKIAILDYKW